MRAVRRWAGVAGLLAAALASACTGGAPAPAPPAAAPAPTSATPSPRVDHPTVWLCRPGLPANPCEGDLDATVLGPAGSTREAFRPAADPPVDCFYVYPTVSPAPTTNAPLRAGPAEVQAVRAQAARFAEVCRVFAPVYRQITSRGLATGGLTDRKARALAHADVVSAWHEYLARHSAGRRFVLIGHSQGTFELTQLLQEEIDGNAALRARLVSALLIGGYVGVRPGRDTGDLSNVPACRRPAQTGCVVAYNSYAGVPPAGSLFGRPSSGREILCTNPAALAGGPAALRPYLPAGELGRPGRGFVTFRGALRAECRKRAGVSWLDVTGTTPQARQLLAAASGRPTWGLHRADVSIALGDLVALVRAQIG
ncbi:MAG TPA: DUF3089 domain-containing protein [Mycobacteriales bacterium]|nr:DUF3089 domain-containing protein [Mycobacteriales bacterium]